MGVSVKPAAAVLWTGAGCSEKCVDVRIAVRKTGVMVFSEFLRRMPQTLAVFLVCVAALGLPESAANAQQVDRMPSESQGPRPDVQQAPSVSSPGSFRKPGLACPYGAGSLAVPCRNIAPERPLVSPRRGNRHGSGSFCRRILTQDCTQAGAITRCRPREIIVCE